MDELTALTERLVATASHEDATAAGDAIEAWLRTETDAVVERDAVGNVIASRHAVAAGPDGETESFALVGHHDVVPPATRQTTDDGTYIVERRDGRLYGRGSADMKGALAACLFAFRDAEPPPNRDLLLASFVGEEAGGEGAQHAIDRGFAPEYALVAEGSTNYSSDGVTDVAVAHKGRRASTLVATGTAAHASKPDAGENALYRACDAIDVVRDLEPPATTVFGERVTGSVVATMVDGGDAWNVIPDRCTVTVDERTVPGERASLEHAAMGAGVEWVVDQDLPPMRCRDDAFATAALDAARAVHATRGAPEPSHAIKPHATDAGWLSDAGTACVVCGPAEPGEAHTETESVSLEVLDRCRAIYTALAHAEW